MQRLEEIPAFCLPKTGEGPPQNFALLTNCAQEKDYAVWMGESKKKDAVWRQKEARIILFKF